MKAYFLLPQATYMYIWHIDVFFFAWSSLCPCGMWRHSFNDMLSIYFRGTDVGTHCRMRCRVVYSCIMSSIIFISVCLAVCEPATMMKDLSSASHAIWPASKRESFSACGAIFFMIEDAEDQLCACNIPKPMEKVDETAHLKVLIVVQICDIWCGT